MEEQRSLLASLLLLPDIPDLLVILKIFQMFRNNIKKLNTKLSFKG